MTGSYSYSYAQRRGLRDITWEVFYGLCKGLARSVAGFAPDVIVGLARGGLYPAMQLAHLMRADFLAVRLTRRVHDEVVREHPEWLVRPDASLEGRRVLIVDEVCDSGETLRFARDEVLRVGATAVATCVLYSHTRAADVPDYAGIVTDELLLNPWDREILVDGGRFVTHPEYLAACRAQGLDPGPIDLGVPPIEPAKG